MPPLPRGVLLLPFRGLMDGRLPLLLAAELGSPMEDLLRDEGRGRASMGMELGACFCFTRGDVRCPLRADRHGGDARPEHVLLIECQDERGARPHINLQDRVHQEVVVGPFARGASSRRLCQRHTGGLRPLRLLMQLRELHAGRALGLPVHQAV